jgi:hypothetical protein
VLSLDFPQFFLGAKVDGAKSFTLAPQALKFLFDFRKIRQWIGWAEFGQLGNGSRFNFQHVADFPPDVAEPAFGALEALLCTCKFFTRGAGGFECRPRITISRGQRHFGGLQPVGAFTP